MISQIFNIISNKDKKKIVLIVIGLLIISVLEILSISAIPAFVYLFLDMSQFKIVLSNYNLDLDFLNNKNQETLLISSSIVLIFIFLLKGLFITLFNFYHYSFNYEIKKNLCVKMFSKYIDEKYEIIKQKSNSQITRDILIETSHFIDVIDNLILLAREVLLLFGIAIILVMTDPFVTLIISVLLSLIIILFYFIFRKTINERGKIVQHERERLFQWINQTFGSILDIKIFSKYSFFYSLFSNSVKKYEKQNLFMNFISSLPKNFLEIISVSIILLLIIVHVHYNKSLISFLPLLTLLVISLVKMIPSFNNLIISFNILKYRKPSLELIYQNLKNYKNFNISRKKNLRIIKTDNIILKDISYKYSEKNEFVLKDVNLEIKKKEFTAIIGKSGSGKTTLMLLLLGVLNPTKGKIFLDNDILNEKNIDAWQQNLSYVSQSPYLLNDTVKNNITFGDEINKIDKEFLNKICEVTKINEFTNKFKNGIETIIADNGSNLSGGQKQRISIARALYKKSSYIFFDEATNALDEKLEKEILELISKNFPELTKILITHRLSSIKDADNIIYYENGIFKQTNNIDIIKTKLIDVN
ncbi:ATP-binding cassette domain-containing protein [Candidatus Pelagibacter sp.]|uniref:ATP-binding cassette domain-containing protein n=1 Tax=Candidatus Pelagibacter sp. TaxID=2024849 RepID=UPI003F8487AF